MAEIRNPLGRGPGIRLPQPTKRGGPTGRKGASAPAGQAGGADGAGLAQEHHGEPKDALDQEHGRGGEAGQGSAAPQATLAAQGHKAAMQSPKGLSLRAGVGQTAARSSNLQTAREHAPAVLTAALSQLNMLAQPVAFASGTEPAGRQEQLREMSKLLRQAALQHGFNEAEAQTYGALAQRAGLESNVKVMAAAQYLRPTTPGLTAQANPFAVLSSIHEGEEAEQRAAQAAAQEAAHEAHLQALAQAPVVQSREGAKRAEGVDGNETKHADDARAKIQDAHARASKNALSSQSAARARAQAASNSEAIKAGYRGHTMADRELSVEDLGPKKRG